MTESGLPSVLPIGVFGRLFGVEEIEGKIHFFGGGAPSPDLAKDSNEAFLVVQIRFVEENSRRTEGLLMHKRAVGQESAWVGIVLLPRLPTVKFGFAKSKRSNISYPVLRKTGT